MTRNFRVAVFAVAALVVLAGGYRLLHPRAAPPPVAEAVNDAAMPVNTAPAPAVEVNDPAQPPGEFGTGSVSGGDGAEPGRLDCAAAAKLGKRLSGCKNTWTQTERDQYTALEAALAAGKSPGAKGKASDGYEYTRQHLDWYGTPLGEDETDLAYHMRLIRERGAVIDEAAWREPRCQAYLRIDNGTPWIDRFIALSSFHFDPSKGAAYTIDFCKRKTSPDLSKMISPQPKIYGGGD